VHLELIMSTKEPHFHFKHTVASSVSDSIRLVPVAAVTFHPVVPPGPVGNVRTSVGVVGTDRGTTHH
jgi:hypothetical protein